MGFHIQLVIYDGETSIGEINADGSVKRGWVLNGVNLSFYRNRDITFEFERDDDYDADVKIVFYGSDHSIVKLEDFVLKKEGMYIEDKTITVPYTAKYLRVIVLADDIRTWYCTDRETVDSPIVKNNYMSPPKDILKWVDYNDERTDGRKRRRPTKAVKDPNEAYEPYSEDDDTDQEGYEDSDYEYSSSDDSDSD
ncbi:hypothetical protein [Carp edema virus]|nr:hypothetical protein [Carp edema virus]